MSEFFWVPTKKYELVQWLTTYFNENKFSSMNKKQLYAIYYATRRALQYERKDSK